jgi:hypothetical protein
MNNLNTYIMKKSKLSLEKFRVSKLSNLSNVVGGTDVGGGGTTGTQTDDEKVKLVCILGSIINLPEHLCPNG